MQITHTHVELKKETARFAIDELDARFGDFFLLLHKHVQAEPQKDTERAAIDELDARIDALREAEDREKEDKRLSKRQKKDEEEAKSKEGLAEGFTDMMGFGGFGGSKKKK